MLPAMSHNPLTPVHESLGAFLVRRAGISVPDYFDDPVAEHLAVRRAVGVFDLTSAGKIAITGPERMRFLQGILPTDVSRLVPGQGALTMLLTAAGKVASLMRLLVLPEAVLLLSPSITRAKLLRTLGVLAAATDVTVTDLTGEMVLLSVQGAQADQVCRDALGLAPFELPVFGGVRLVTPAHGDVTLVRSPRSGEVGLDLLIGSENATAAFRAVLDAVRAADGVPAGLRALDSLRIETGIAAYGADVDESTTPHEAGLVDGIVSFEKGCFLGREALSATEFLGRPERRLRGIAFRSAVSPVPGDRVLLDDLEVGRITSACFAPSLGHAVALALLASPQVRSRSAVRIADGEIGIVTGLPFRNG